MVARKDLQSRPSYDTLNGNKRPLSSRGGAVVQRKTNAVMPSAAGAGNRSARWPSQGQAPVNPTAMSRNAPIQAKEEEKPEKERSWFDIGLDWIGETIGKGVEFVVEAGSELVATTADLVTDGAGALVGVFNEELGESIEAAGDDIAGGVRAFGDEAGNFTRDVVHGAIAGDAIENPNAAQIAGMVGIGMVPILGQIADVRDLAGGVIAGDAQRIATSAMGFAPGAGDALKHADKALGLLKYADEATGLLKNADEAAGALAAGNRVVSNATPAVGKTATNVTAAAPAVGKTATNATAAAPAVGKTASNATEAAATTGNRTAANATEQAAKNANETAGAASKGTNVAKNGSTSKNPNGYSRNDIDQHKYLSPGKNRAAGNKNIAADGRVQSHHIIQDKWAQKNVAGYKRGEAPAILLETGTGKTHTAISNAQRARRADLGYGTTIRDEFNSSYRQMIDAGVNQKQARKAIGKSYKYFDGLDAFQ